MSSYLVPKEAWITNPDQHTIQISDDGTQSETLIDVTANQTTAIRIDDSTIHHRETWSSEKIADFYNTTAKVQFGTSEQWAEQPTFVPNDGEFIIYTDRNIIDGVLYPGIKIGDGFSYISELPFVGDDIVQEILALINSHINNSDIHVTTANKQFWDNKLNFTVTGELLEFTRN